MAVSDILELKVYCFTGDQLGLNVRHFIIDAKTGVDQPMTVWATSFEPAIANAIRPLLAANAVFSQISLQKIFPLPKEVAAVDGADAGGGGYATKYQPTQVSGIISLKTALAGRANRGRIYVPFPPTEANDANSLPNPAYQAKLDAYSLVVAANRVIVAPGGVSSISVSPVIYHRSTGTFTRITNSSTPYKWATQRRRGSYGQPNTPI